MDNRFITEYRGQIEMKVRRSLVIILECIFPGIFQGKGTNSTYWLMGKAKKSSMNVINRTSTTLKCPFSGKSSNEHISNGTKVFFDREEIA